jgi:hypothetical protein
MKKQGERKRWRDLTPSQKVIGVITSVVQVGLLVAALWDIRHRAPEELRGSKKLWTGLVFINWVGPIAYFLVGRKR